MTALVGDGGSRKARYLWGLGSGYVATAASMLVGLWLTPFSLRYLSRAEFAIFTIASDLLVWMTLVDLGIASGLRVQAAQLVGRGEPERLSRLASTTLVGEGGVALAMALGGVGLAAVFPDLFVIPQELRSDARGVVFLLVLSSAVNMVSQAFSAVLLAHQQIHFDNLIRLLFIAVRTAVTALLLASGFGVYALAIANLSAVSLSCGIAVVRCHRTLPRIRISPRLASWADLRGLGSMGAWFTVGGLAGILIEGMDRVVAARVVSLESVTTLALTGRLYLVAYGLVSQITNTARPGIGQLLGRRDIASVRRVHTTLSLVSTGVAIAVALGIWAGNGPFVRWWVGERNYGGLWLDTAFAANLVINCWVLPSRATLAAGLVVRPQGVSRLLEGMVNLAL